MTALICGSFAYDTIMTFDGKFKDHIMPDRVHMLNVAFMVPDLQRNFGGTAGNIIYNMNLLGGDGLAMGTVGADFGSYRDWLNKHGINDKYVTTIDSEYCAQAYITTDMEDNQITAFHPGAMNHAHTQSVPTGQGIKMGIVAPDGRDGMIEHARQFAEAGIPFMFDPGQGLPMFDGNDLEWFVEKATWVAVNDYEAGMLEEKTGLSRQQIGDKVEALIVTLGGDGSVIYADEEVHVEPVKPAAIKDPTGCGDAYRAALLTGLSEGKDWKTAGRMASLMGSIKVASTGPQNHSLTRDEFAKQFKEAFGVALD
ncbi:carbohydrate kinase family protein [Salicola sp. Rm-C-2C1-2]|uniref:carbohydrate kinase family protein n=1 Tax=Salicola sp. Rm-C-2C1-2 TaxID=3141321 RepID=UPI0032E37679